MIKYACVAVTLPLCALAASAHAQVTGTRNEALLSSTVDAGALEAPARVSLAVGAYVPDGWTAGIAIRLGSGSLHTLLRRGSLERGLNVGYAQILGAHELPLWFGASVGVDATGGMLRTSRSDRKTTASVAHVSVPLALRWHTPADLSVAVYAAPYGEAGRASRYSLNCLQVNWCDLQYQGVHGTSAAGIAVGGRVRVWRFGVDIGFRDVVLRDGRLIANDEGTGLLTFRF